MSKRNISSVYGKSISASSIKSSSINPKVAESGIQNLSTDLIHLGSMQSQSKDSQTSQTNENNNNISKDLSFKNHSTSLDLFQMEKLRTFRICDELETQMKEGIQGDAEDLIENVRHMVQNMFTYMHSTLDLYSLRNPSQTIHLQDFKETHDKITQTKENILETLRTAQNKMMMYDDSKLSWSFSKTQSPIQK
jgi:hypothetical protein